MYNTMQNCTMQNLSVSDKYPLPKPKHKRGDGGCSIYRRFWCHFGASRTKALRHVITVSTV